MWNSVFASVLVYTVGTFWVLLLFLGTVTKSQYGTGDWGQNLFFLISDPFRQIPKSIYS